jgi:death-on-curing protein
VIRYLTLAEVIRLHDRIISETGGANGLRDIGALESALAQPRQTFGGEDLYTSLPSKATALGFSLIMNHPFVDGNKRIGHAAMDAFLMLNGCEIQATVDDAEAEILGVAAGERTRDEFLTWVERHIVPLP